MRVCLSATIKQKNQLFTQETLSGRVSTLLPKHFSNILNLTDVVNYISIHSK